MLKYKVKITPILAPRKAGAKTPPIKPILKQVIVSKSLKLKNKLHE